MERVTLESCLSLLDLRERLAGRQVLIWSGEHGAYWRAQCCGYAEDVEDAGVYSFEDALSSVKAAAPEKKIEFDIFPELSECDQTVLRHALGLDEYMHPTRSHYAVSDDKLEFKRCKRLSELGLMIRSLLNETESGRPIFWVTSVGAKSIGCRLPTH